MAIARDFRVCVLLRAGFLAHRVGFDFGSKLLMRGNTTYDRELLAEKNCWCLALSLQPTDLSTLGALEQLLCAFAWHASSRPRGMYIFTHVND